MRALLRISRGIDALNEWLGVVGYWLVLPMIVIGVWNVIGRFLGRAIGQNLASNSFIELQWYIFSIIFFLGAAYTLKYNGHVRVDVFYGNFDWRRKALVNVLGSFLFLLPFCLIVIYFSWTWVLTSWVGREMSNDAGGLPRYPIKTMILVGFGLLALQGISEAIKNIAALRGHLPPPGETSAPAFE